MIFLLNIYMLTKEVHATNVDQLIMINSCETCRNITPVNEIDLNPDQRHCQVCDNELPYVRQPVRMWWKQWKYVVFLVSQASLQIIEIAFMGSVLYNSDPASVFSTNWKLRGGTYGAAYLLELLIVTLVHLHKLRCGLADSD